MTGEPLCLGCQLKGNEAIEATYQQKLKALEEENKSDATTIAELQEERDQAKVSAEKAAVELAKNQPGEGSELYQEAQRLFSGWKDRGGNCTIG
jgi:hypothetical protein